MQSQLAFFVSLEPGSAIDPEWLPLLDPPGHLRGSEQLVAWDLLSFQVTSSPVWLQTCAPPPLPPECKACMWTRVSFQMESVVWVMAALPSGRVLCDSWTCSLVLGAPTTTSLLEEESVCIRRFALSLPGPRSLRTMGSYNFPSPILILFMT